MRKKIVIADRRKFDHFCNIIGGAIFAIAFNVMFAVWFKALLKL